MRVSYRRKTPVSLSIYVPSLFTAAPDGFAVFRAMERKTDTLVGVYTGLIFGQVYECANCIPRTNNWR